MRLALLSDIHGNLAALEAVVADIRRRGADQIVNLGDSLSGPLLPLETAHYLMAADWICLAGNSERQLLTLGPGTWGLSDEYAHSQLGAKELDWLRSHPPSLRLTEEIFLCHGTPASDCEYFFETAIPGGTRPSTADEIETRLYGERSPVVACGHTHTQRSLRSRSGQLLVNCGSVGLPAFDDVFPLEHVVETGSPDARYAILEKVGGAWRAGLYTVPYDHESMARLASERGRPEWALGLRTGYMI